MLQKWKVYLFSQLKIKENPPNLQIIQTHGNAAFFLFVKV